MGNQGKQHGKHRPCRDGQGPGARHDLDQEDRVRLLLLLTDQVVYVSRVLMTTVPDRCTCLLDRDVGIVRNKAMTASLIDT